MINLKIPAKYREIANKCWYVAVWIIIGIGILLRMALYLQDRNLIIDDANIVRNVQERGFLELVLPLSYESYAPPVFLWAEKLVSLFWNYGERAMTFYPLVCGIGALFVFRSIMRRYISDFALMLPMALMSWTYLLIKYSVMVKQYMPDAFIALLLIHFALRRDIFTMPRKKFVLFWAIAGTVSIWASMPAVFMLTGVGFYYACICIKAKKWDFARPLALLAAIWIAQFGIYYWFILKSQIQSDYLQNYHHEYFLYALPANSEEWDHNWQRIKEILNNTAGFSQYSMYTAIAFICLGLINMIRKNVGLMLLIAGPVFLTLFAAALKQFSLIDRLILFILPLLTLMIGFGVGWLSKIRTIIVPIILLYIGVDIMKNFNQFKLFHEFQGFHEITENFGYLKAHHAKGDQIYIHDACVATYAYYTEVHPDKDKWASLKGAHRMNWDTDYEVVTRDVKDTVYFVYTGGFPDEERKKRTSQIEQHMQQVDYFEKYISFVYMYVPKQQASIPQNAPQPE